MLLAIDVGNTETVIGLFSLGPDDEPPGHARPASSEPPEPAGMTHHWRLSTVDDRTPDEHALLLSNLLELSRLQFDEVVSGMAVTSSVPLVKTSLRQMAERWFDMPCVVLEPGLRSGMPILYDNPKEVGPDRIANAVGAYDLYGGPVHRGRHGDRDDVRRDLGRRRVPRWGDRSWPRDIARRPFPPRRGFAARRARRAPQRHRQVDGGVHPIRRALRIRRAGGRHVHPIRRRARSVHGGRYGRPLAMSSPRCRSASSITSHG